MPQLHYDDRYASFWKFFYVCILTWFFFLATDWAINNSRFLNQQTTVVFMQQPIYMFEFFFALVIAIGVVIFMDSGYSNKDGSNLEVAREMKA